MCRQVQLVNKAKDESNLLTPAVVLGIHNMSEFQNSELQRYKTSLYECRYLRMQSFRMGLIRVLTVLQINDGCRGYTILQCDIGKILKRHS